MLLFTDCVNAVGLELIHNLKLPGLVYIHVAVLSTIIAGLDHYM